MKVFIVMFLLKYRSVVFKVILGALVLPLLLMSCGGSDSKQKDYGTLTLVGPSEEFSGNTVEIQIQVDSEITDFEFFLSIDGNDFNPINGVSFREYLSYEVPVDSHTFVVEARANDGEIVLSASHTVNVIHAYNLRFEHEDVSNTVLLGIWASIFASSSVYEFVVPENIDALNVVSECGNGNGTKEITYLNSNDPVNVAVGDSIFVEFNACEIWPSATVSVTGSLSFSVTQVLESGGMTVSVDFTNIMVDQFYSQYSINLSGLLSINILSGQESYSSEVLNVSDFGVEHDFFSDINYSELRVSHYIDLVESTYEIGYASEYTIDEWATLSVIQNSPIVGNLGEYPLDSLFTITDQIGQSLNITEGSEFYRTSAMFTVGDSELSVLWEDVVTAYAWSLPGEVIVTPSEPLAGNLTLVGVFSELEDAPVNGALELLYSRDVLNIDTTDAYYRSTSAPHEWIPVVYEVDGKRLFLSAETALRPGVEYEVGGFQVNAVESGGSAYLQYFNIAVSDAIFPEIRADSMVYNASGLPRLDAGETTLTRGELLRYEWVDLDNLGITFSEPNYSTTNFTLPGGVMPSDIRLGLNVINTLGDEASSEVVLRYLDAEGDYLFVTGQKGERITSGQSRLVNLEGKTIFIYDDLPNIISLLIEDEISSWSIQIRRANSQPLEPGVYTNTGPSDSGTSHYISFSGWASSCSNSYGEFEIHEIAYDAEGNLESLAVDFKQHCESLSMPPSHGILRYNSDVPPF